MNTTINVCLNSLGLVVVLSGLGREGLEYATTTLSL